MVIENKFMVEISRSDSLILYENKDGVMTNIGFFPLTSYALDKEMAFSFLEIIRKMKPLIIIANGQAFYGLDDEFGQILKMITQIFEKGLSFREKILFIERTQFFTLLEEGKYKELADCINVLYVIKKLE